MNPKNILLPLKKGYVAIDIESQGYAKNCPIEISAVRYAPDGSRRDAFTTFVKPRTHSVSKYVTELTGITYQMVKSAPSPYDVIPTLAEYIGDMPLLGHAIADNDLPILDYYARAVLKREFTNPVVDTLPLSQALYPDLGHWGLQTLADEFGIMPRTRHRAEADCETTSQVYQHIAGKYRSLTKRERAKIRLAIEKGAGKGQPAPEIDIASLPEAAPDGAQGKRAGLRLWHWEDMTRLRVELSEEIPQNALKAIDSFPKCIWYAAGRIIMAENVTQKALQGLVAALVSDGFSLYRSCPK